MCELTTDQIEGIGSVFLTLATVTTPLPLVYTTLTVLQCSAVSRYLLLTYGFQGSLSSEGRCLLVGLVAWVLTLIRRHVLVAGCY
ncbi:hypothetical protein F4810DRAFT_651924 [Camillea tinctor]|nr:hypothetical protein F4810DRAFT_651924 [Camillea tinctor]